MSQEVNLPALGESVTEGTVTRWLKKVGDTVAVDEPLVEISTDKVDTEIPSPIAGVIEEILVAEDETVEVGAVLARIGDGSAAAAPVATPAPEEAPAPAPAAQEPVAPPAPPAPEPVAPPAAPVAAPPAPPLPQHTRIIPARSSPYPHHPRVIVSSSPHYYPRIIPSSSLLNPATSP